MKTGFVAAFSMALWWSAPPVHAEQYVASDSGWTVFKPSPDQCAAVSSYEDGTSLIFILTFGQPNVVGVALTNASWNSLEPNKQYPVAVTVDSTTTTITSVGTAYHGKKGIIFAVPGDLNAVTSHHFQVWHNGSKLFSWHVSNHDADIMNVLWNCGKVSSDPFR